MSAGVVVWITGLPQSGKSTLAARLRSRTARAGKPSVVLDGDDVRACVRPRPGYSAKERDHFYETLARLAAAIAHQGLVVLVPATAHRRRYRALARRLAPKFIEVYVATPASICAERDRKGLYARAAQARIRLPGSGEDFEPPLQPDVLADGGEDRGAVEALLRMLRIAR